MWRSPLLSEPAHDTELDEDAEPIVVATHRGDAVLIGRDHPDIVDGEWPDVAAAVAVWTGVVGSIS